MFGSGAKVIIDEFVMDRMRCNEVFTDGPTCGYLYLHFALVSLNEQSIYGFRQDLLDVELAPADLSIYEPKDLT